MSKKKFGMIGAGIFSGAILFAVILSFVVSGRSQAEFTALSDEAMAHLIGGTEYTKGNLIQSQSGSFANCDYPNCPTEQFVFRPTIYSCFTCYPGDPKHYRATVYKKITSWCDNTVQGQCPYKSYAQYPRDDCETSLNTTC